MHTWSLSIRRFIPFLLLAFLLLAAAVSLSSFLSSKNTARANRFVLKGGDLYSLSETLGEKRLTNTEAVKILFDERDGNILFGKGWGNELSGETERHGGTELWTYSAQTGQFQKIHDGYETTLALFGSQSQVFFTTRDQDLFMSNLDGSGKRKLQTKVLSPSISPDGKRLVYQKLSPEWQLGEYFDGALGLTLLDIGSNQETRLTNLSEDWGAIFTPDGQNVVFVSPNSDGLSAFFRIKLDGSGRMQLTNAGQKTFTKQSIPVPSEKPIFSQDGRVMVYESDREIWTLRFNSDFTNIEKAERVAYGVNPRWVRDGESLSVISAPMSGKQQTVKLK